MAHINVYAEEFDSMFAKVVTNDKGFIGLQLTFDDLGLDVLTLWARSRKELSQILEGLRTEIVEVDE